MTLQEMTQELEKKRAWFKEMGGPERIKRQHDKGKLTVRKRTEILFDEGAFLELGLLALPEGFTGEEEIRAPADGVVTGVGKIDGRWVACAAYDFTVFGGSIGETSEKKVTRIRDLALKERIPIIWLIDSAGARIHAGAKGSGFGGLSGQATQVSMFAGTGYLFREQSVMSGVIPQVSAMVGPGAAGTAYIPGLADFVPMVKGTSSMALGGPPLVRSIVGEDITEDELGGSQIHNVDSGCADQEYENDEECLKAVREYLSYFPSHCREKPPVRECSDPVDRAEEKILKVVPDNPRRAYDMHKLIKYIVDDKTYFEIKPHFARNLITCFARFGGRPAGIVANNPMFLGGALENDSADKAARFVMLCDAFNIPLVFLQDVPGFMVGSKVEKEGIIRHGAKMLFAVSCATVPKITVVVRKAYGAGYYVMCGRAYEPDFIAAWPTAEISVMGAEGMVSIAARKVLEAAENPEETKKQLAAMIQPHISPYRAANMGYIDDVIDPRRTREVIARALDFSWNKTVERPWRKHGVIPV